MRHHFANPADNATPTIPLAGFDVPFHSRYL
jgi:hypothetical protein